MENNPPVTTAEPKPSPERPQYEFSEEQNKVFSELAGNLSFFGWFCILAVVVFHAILLGRWLIYDKPMYDKFRAIYVLWPLFVLAICAPLIAAAGKFNKVVQTQNNDIDHLMAGLNDLNQTFAFLNFFPAIWLIAAVVGGIVLGAILAFSHIMGY